MEMCRIHTKTYYVQGEEISTVAHFSYFMKATIITIEDKKAKK